MSKHNKPNTIQSITITNINVTDNILNQEKNKLNYDQIIELLGVYEAEFEHRDNILYSRLFTLSYISLFIMLLPYWANISSFSLPRITVISIGIVNEIITFIISIIQANRLDCISSAYRKLCTLLPAKYRKPSITRILIKKSKEFNNAKKQKRNKDHKLIGLKNEFYKIQLTYFSPCMLCICIIIIGIALIFLC